MTRKRTSAPPVYRIPIRRVIGLAICFSCLLAGSATADLRTPGWYDPNAVGSAPDWHYRVPIEIQNGVVDSTVRVDVDFAGLLTALGVSGALDPNSPRVVRSGGSLCARQQYTDRVYNGGSDAAGNDRGEIRFILEDNGTLTYFLYFDTLANGAKPAWDVANTINGNFEFSTDRQEDPPGWSARIYRAGYQAMAIADDPGLTVTDGSGTPSSVTTDEVARTGQYCYMLGARDNTEPASRNPSTRLERRIAVPASNPGLLRIRYRIKGWDSSDDNYTNWDFIQIQVRRGSTTELVGPAAGNYTTLPFSANLGRNNATANRSGYGPYNHWDADTDGDHHAGMTLVPGSEPWFTVTQDLTAWAGQTITLRIQTRNSTLYKSWYHVDDVEWSVTEGALGVAQGFGVNVTAPNDTATGPASVYNDGDTLVIRAQVDAAIGSATADLFNPDGDAVQSGIVLFNDGTHGDAVAGDAIWTNDGSIPSEGTYGFGAANKAGSTWQVVVSAMDQSLFTATDTQAFTLVTLPNIMLLKSVSTYSDPVNHTTNAKAIPGAYVTYTIRAGNHGGGSTDPDSIEIIDPIPANTAFYVGSLPPFGPGPVAFVHDPLVTGLTFDPDTDLWFSSDGGLTFTIPVSGLSGDANGCDASITHIRINPKGAFNGSSITTVPEFSVHFRVRVQ